MCAIGSQEITRPSSGNCDHLVEAVDGAHEVRVGELHALRRPGGARGVDQREQVVGLHGAPGGLEVEALRGVLPPRSCRRRPRRSRARPRRAPRTRSTKASSVTTMRASASFTWYWICSARVGVVERERRGAEVQRRGVEPVELRPVREHQRHRARRARGRARPGRRPPRAPCRRTRARSSRARRPWCAARAVGMGLGGQLEGLGHRGRVEPSRPSGAASVVTAMCVL